jgi:shikimate dehydrogenase
MRSIDGHTKVCVVIGDPIGHTLSPLLHNFAYEELGISSQYVFVPCRVASAGLGDAVHGLRAANVRGISVTLPHKTDVVRFMDELDPLAGKIGAVNTIVNQGGTLKGYNTDVEGILAPLEIVTTLQKKKVAVLGAGGAARSAAYALRSRGAEVAIFNRTPERAESLALELDIPWGDLRNLAELEPYDILVHCTSVGMAPKVDESLLPEAVFHPGQLVFDCVYTPYETKLLRLAKAGGARTIHGVEMFIYQAAKQFELYTGLKAPIARMRETLLNHFAGQK